MDKELEACKALILSQQYMINNMSMQIAKLQKCTKNLKYELMENCTELYEHDPLKIDWSDPPHWNKWAKDYINQCKS